MKALRPTALMLALFALTSCAYAPGDISFIVNRCGADYSEYLQGIDWEKAKKIKVRIRQGDFRPSYIGMYMEQAYVMSIENADDSSHSFRAIEFFRAVALEGLREVGESFQNVECLDGIAIPPRKTMELRFVAVRDGTYEFDSNPLMISLAMVGSSGGFITIEPPRIISESPLKSLKLRESSALGPVEEEAKPPGLFDDPEEDSGPGLFDDQEETTEPPPGLFDDEDVPDEPPTGLFDDDEPLQPIEPSPSMPVESVPAPDLEPEEKPDEGLFGEPIQPDVTEPQPDEGLFGEPAPELVPDETPPEAPIVDVTPEIPSDEPAEELFEVDPEVIEEEEEIVETEPKAPVEELFEPEEELFFEEEPTTEIPDETLPEAPIESVDEVPESVTAETEKTVPEAVPVPEVPSAIPEGYAPLDGPPADIYSDPPDAVNTGPGSGGDSGEDLLGSTG